MITEQKDGTLWLSVYCQPGASKSEIVGPHGDALKIRIKAPPVEGKANEALIEFLAKKLGTNKRSLEIVRGQTQRQKVVSITGLDLAEVAKRLGL